MVAAGRPAASKPARARFRDRAWGIYGPFIALRDMIDAIAVTLEISFYG